MAYQAVNRAVAGNSEADKPWQKAVFRNMAEQIPTPSPPAQDRPSDNERVSSNIPDPDPSAIIQRVSQLSIDETDKIIQELQKLRGFLLSEGERMRREIADYLKLAQATISSTKAMSETIPPMTVDAGKENRQGNV
jgi:hypothetical protein